MKFLLNYFICKLKKHILVNSGSCPFTGKNYAACLRCGVTITK